MNEAVKKFSKLIPLLLLIVVILIARALPTDSNLSLVLVFTALVAVLIASMFMHKPITPEERTKNLRFLLNIRRPEETKKRVLQLVGFLLFLFTPLLFFLYIGSKYVLLDERLYYRLGYVIVVLFFFSFLIPSLNRGLKEYPIWMNLAARTGACVPVVAALFSVALALNCAKNNSVRTRDVICLGKRPTLGSNPACYVRIRPWAKSDREVEVEVPGEVFAAVRPGSGLRITTGVGRLGVEWIRRVEVRQ